MERKKILSFSSKVLDNKNIAPAVKHLTLTIPENFDFYPGQFISLILSKNGMKIKRPYSISSKPGLNFIDLCIKIVENGLVTPIINKLKTNDEINVLGPMGDFIIKNYSKNLVLISTGTGIGPFRSIIYDLLENNKNNFKNKIILLTGYRYEEDVLYEQEFLNLKNKYKNFFYERVLSKTTINQDKERINKNIDKDLNNKQNNKNLDNNKNNNYDNEKKYESNYEGYVQSLVKNHLDASGNTHYYICGLKEMVNSVKEILEQQGIPKENIFFEKYD